MRHARSIVVLALAVALVPAAGCTASTSQVDTPLPARTAAASIATTLSTSGLEIVQTDAIEDGGIGRRAPAGYALVVGTSAITSAEATTAFFGGPEDAIALVIVRVTPGGRRALHRITNEKAGARLALLKDGLVVTAPYAPSPIDSDELAFSVNATGAVLLGIESRE